MDCKVSSLTASKIMPGRDLLKEFAQACREEGVRVGFYYNCGIGYERYFKERESLCRKNR